MNPEADYIKQAFSDLPLDLNFPVIIEKECPSNIALVKYWGKKDGQLPGNPSLSISLKKSVSKVKLICNERAGKKELIEYLFNGKKNELFEKRVISYIESIKIYFPFLDNIHLKIETCNTFPHGAGIASSASSFGAIALAIMSLEKQLYEVKSDFLKKSSFIARLGSGSACRSVYRGWNLWGKTKEINDSSDFYAVNINDLVHENFHQFCDSVLIINSSPKSVSSSEGHRLMDKHPFRTARFDQANENFINLIKVLKQGEINDFIDITESEALSLHAMMLTSIPAYTLLEPNTLSVIKKIRNFRAETQIPVCFTLDAGPNVHILFPDSYSQLVNNFINDELSVFCEKGMIIEDKVEIVPASL